MYGSLWPKKWLNQLTDLIQPFTISHCTDWKLSRTSKVGERELSTFRKESGRREAERPRERGRREAVRENWWPGGRLWLLECQLLKWVSIRRKFTILLSSLLLTVSLYSLSLLPRSWWLNARWINRWWFKWRKLKLSSLPLPLYSLSNLYSIYSLSLSLSNPYSFHSIIWNRH